MTVIIGLEHEGKVYMGADSAGSDGWMMRALSNPKVFTIGNHLIGCTGSPRMLQLLQYHLVPPAQDEGESDEHYMVVQFMEAVRVCLKSFGFASIDNNEETGGLFLVGYHGRLYRGEPNFALLSYNSQVDAVGIGDKVALGAMLALEKQPPVERIQRSLEIVGQLSDGVLPPYSVQVLE